MPVGFSKQDTEDEGATSYLAALKLPIKQPAEKCMRSIISILGAQLTRLHADIDRVLALQDKLLQAASIVVYTILNILPKLASTFRNVGSGGPSGEPTQRLRAQLNYYICCM